MPHGMEVLLDEVGVLEDYVIQTEKSEIVGSAFKVQGDG